MLKKREWLKRWEAKMYGSGEFEPCIVKLLKEDILDDWKRELTPGESVNINIDTQDKMELVFGGH